MSASVEMIRNESMVISVLEEISNILKRADIQRSKKLVENTMQNVYAKLISIVPHLADYNLEDKDEAKNFREDTGEYLNHVRGGDLSELAKVILQKDLDDEDEEFDT